MCGVMQKYLNEAKDEARIESIAKLLSNGGTEEDAKRFLDASQEEMRAAMKRLENGIVPSNRSLDSFRAEQLAKYETVN